MLEVTLHREDGDAERFTISGSALIGRHSACDVRIQDPMASRRHGELVVSETTCKLKDLGAATPLRVNGIVVKGEQQLHHNDVIGIGNVRLRVEINPSLEALRDPDQAKQATAENDRADYESTVKAEMPHVLYGGNTIPLRSSMVFGRFRECDVQITEKMASWRHFEITIDEDGRPWLQDLETVNGTRLNGKRVGSEKVALGHGNRISVGASHLIVQLPQGEVAEAASTDSEQVSGQRDQLSSLSGRQISGYRLGDMIGEGSLAVVFKATQMSLRREVAVKVFRPSVLQSNEEFGELLLEAARLSGRVEHDNISRIHECGQEDGDLLWYSMELVNGQSLEYLIDRDGPFPIETALVILERISRGLEAARQADICHFDLRPASVLINETGTVKILDLGLGQALQEVQQSSMSSIVVGNPAYMSPERCRGEAGDHQSDIYALGCLLHFMLRGLPPPQNRNPVALLKAQQKNAIPSLADHGFPTAIDSLLAGLLAKKAEWRFGDYAELLLALQRCKTSIGKKAEQGTYPTSGTPHKTTQPVSAATTHPAHSRRAGKRRSTSLATLINVIIAVGLIITLLMFGPQVLDHFSSAQQGSEQANNQLGVDAIAVNHLKSSDNTLTAAANDRNTGVDDSLQARWQRLRNEAEAATAAQQFAQAERMVQRFAEDFAQGDNPQAAALRPLIDSRLTIIQSQGTQWYQEQLQALPQGMQDRIQRLASMRGRVIQRFRSVIEARYQGAIEEANNQLLAARRQAIVLLEENRANDLPDLAEQTLTGLGGTPIEDLSKQFLTLCEEASRLPSSELPWIRQRSSLLQQLHDPNVDPNQGLSAAAALMLDGEVTLAKEFLLGNSQLNQGSLRLRKERILRVDNLILRFESPVDLAFIDVDHGAITLENGIRPNAGSDEPTGLIATNAIRGQSWESGIYLDMDELSAEASTTVSLHQDVRPIFALHLQENGIHFTGSNSQGQSELHDPHRANGETRLRFVAQTTGLTIYVNDEMILADWDLPEINEAKLRLDSDHGNWSLQQLHLLGGGK